MTGGVVRDIRTGRAIGRTRSLTETFVHQVQHMIEDDVEFYVVYGRCQHKEVRDMVSFFRSLDGFPTLYDPQMPSDTAWIFEGDPGELGFAASS